MAKFPSKVYNPVSLIGVGIALVSFGTVLIFFAMDMLGYTQSPYLGIFTYMILPAVLIVGLLLIPLGMLWEGRRLRRQQGRARKYVILDFNEASHRSAAMVFIVGTMLLVVVSAAGTYQAYTYSESVEFCGEVCHTVMMPEYVAYQNSPHARVPCAECHIGEGADWFVKAKVSGMYQVYSVLFDKYHRPIKTPIENLRPARETCEECHWPSKFSSDKKLEKTYFPLDTTDSGPWKIVMDLKIGGGHSELGPTEGIHWHMNEANVVRYIATDRRRQQIPWVETTLSDGSTRIYRKIDGPEEEELRELTVRQMDCIDCHNRPSHIYYPPFRTLNDAIAQGQISQELPNIRAIASHVLSRSYGSGEQAMRQIPTIIRDDYRRNAPEVLSSHETELGLGIAAVQRIFSRNFFPEMKVDWRAYPNNIGHMYDEGCFRCHDNKHVSGDGHVLTNDCNLCHTTVMQGPLDALESNIDGLPFRHPTDIDDAWRDVPCSDCHLGN